MLPRIVLGKLNNVRNLCSIPWTDLIFSAWAYSRAIQEKDATYVIVVASAGLNFPIKSKFKCYIPVSQIEAERHD